VYVGLIDQLMESAAHTFVLNGCRQAGPYGAALCCTMKNFISASVASLRPGSELTVKNSAQLEICWLLQDGSGELESPSGDPVVEQDKYGWLFHAIATTIHGKFLAKRRVRRRVRVAYR